MSVQSYILQPHLNESDGMHNLLIQIFLRITWSLPVRRISEPRSMNRKSTARKGGYREENNYRSRLRADRATGVCANKRDHNGNHNEFARHSNHLRAWEKDRCPH